jgi:hypothetical protein
MERCVLEIVSEAECYEINHLPMANGVGNDILVFH